MQKNSGLTLIESLLVMAIATSIVIMGIRQYTVFKRDADIVQLHENVDTLFLAASRYYQAQCGSGGALDPTIATSSVKSIIITDDLITPGYLTASFPKANPIVDSTGPGQGYIVQFNKYTMPRNQTVCTNPATCSLTQENQIGTIVLWRIQVSVLMRDITAGGLENAKSYLGGLCLSAATGSPETTALCSTNPTGPYVVFDRLSSMATQDPTAQSPLWLMMPQLQLERQMGQTNPMTDLTGQSHATEYQYFYCVI